MNKGYKIISALLVITLIGTAVWANKANDLKSKYEISLNNVYQRMFYDMKDHIETVEVSLSKVMVSSSKEQNVLLLSQIWQQALNAQEKLSQLPLQHENLLKTEKFLNQVGDFCYTLLIGELNDVSKEEKSKSLKDLQEYASMLAEELENAEQKIKDGSATMAMINQEGEEDLQQADDSMKDFNLANFEENMSEYPELIYDGPFSEQTMNIKPKGISGDEITQEQAEQLVKNLVGEDKVTEIYMYEIGENADSVLIPAYTFSLKLGEEEMYMGICKVGGSIIWMENPRSVGSPAIDEGNAQKVASDYLKSLGYQSMEPNYSLIYNNTILFNYAYKEDDVTVYTDLIKVKVALDNSQVVGMDTTAYLKSHHAREADFYKPSISIKEAKKSIKVDFEIEHERLTVIPKHGKIETLCYEFSGKHEGSDFLVYINAKTGKQEEILKIIRNENGTLMI